MLLSTNLLSLRRVLSLCLLFIPSISNFHESAPHLTYTKVVLMYNVRQHGAIKHATLIIKPMRTVSNLLFF